MFATKKYVVSCLCSVQVAVRNVARDAQPTKEDQCGAHVRAKLIRE